ncbi:unnamed protein product, partial [Closterium sp. Naga37s-1]
MVVSAELVIGVALWLLLNLLVPLLVKPTSGKPPSGHPIQPLSAHLPPAPAPLPPAPPCPSPHARNSLSAHPPCTGAGFLEAGGGGVSTQRGGGASCADFTLRSSQLHQYAHPPLPHSLLPARNSLSAHPPCTGAGFAGAGGGGASSGSAGQGEAIVIVKGEEVPKANVLIKGLTEAWIAVGRRMGERVMREGERRMEGRGGGEGEREGETTRELRAKVSKERYIQVHTTCFNPWLERLRLLPAKSAAKRMLRAWFTWGVIAACIAFILASL